EHVAAREGVPAPEVVVDPEAQISKTEGQKVTIEPGTPGEVATRIEHEVQHVAENAGKPAPPEDNAAIVDAALEKEGAAPPEPGEGLPGPHVPDHVNPALEAIRAARLPFDELSRRA